jgi:molecular chaperone GrpE (heat shock protein)
MHDFRYVQVENEIRILEEQILKKQAELHKSILAEFSEETKRMIKNFHRAVSSELEEQEDDKRNWKDAGEVLAKMTESLAESMEDVKLIQKDGEEFYQQEELLERENCEFIAGNGKRFGNQGGRKNNKNLLKLQ